MLGRHGSYAKQYTRLSWQNVIASNLGKDSADMISCISEYQSHCQLGCSKATEGSTVAF